VLEHVHAAIDAGALAVPHGEDAVVACPLKEVGLLAAPHGGGGELLVDPGLEVHVVPIQPGLRLPERLVDAAEGRSAIAGHEGRGVEAALLVALVLQHRQAHERLDAGHVGARRVERVLVVQGYALWRRVLRSLS
jgi:hypothetical protein